MLNVIPADQPRTFEVEFLFDGAPGSVVAVAGSFNDWDPEIHLLQFNPKTGKYAVKLVLEAGYYEYKFVVNGKWVLDDTNNNFSANDFGTLNSVLKLGEL